MSRTSSSLKELKGLREAVLAEEKAKTHALLQNLPENTAALPRVANPPPPAPSALAFDQEVEEEPEAPTSPAPSPVRAPTPAPQPSPARPPAAPAARAPSAVPSPPKVSKEAALIIPLTPKIQERLQKHVEDARWSPAELVMELIRVSLHQGYPAIQYGDELIARAGTYRSFERNPLDSVLKIVSGQGVFSVTVSPESPEYQHWLTYFTNQQGPDPDKSASQVCLFGLQSYLENIEDFKLHGWTKSISPDAFSIAPGG